MNFWNQHLWCHLPADYTIIMSRTLNVMGIHVMYGHSAWFWRVIMSSSQDLCCLLSVKKQKHEFNYFSLDSVFVVSTSGYAKVISWSQRMRLITQLPQPWLFRIWQEPHPIIVLCRHHLKYNFERTPWLYRSLVHSNCWYLNYTFNKNTLTDYCLFFF